MVLLHEMLAHETMEIACAAFLHMSESISTEKVCNRLSNSDLDCFYAFHVCVFRTSSAEGGLYYSWGKGISEDVYIVYSSKQVSHTYRHMCKPCTV